MLLGLDFKLYVFGQGELYLPDSFLQLSAINEIISALCIVALWLLRAALFFYVTTIRLDI